MSLKSGQKRITVQEHVRAITERIVCQAARIPQMSPKAKLGDVIASRQGREQFRVNLAKLAKKENLYIQLGSIPIRRSAKFGEIHRILTMGALPGDPGAGQLGGESWAWSVGSEEPSPPAANEKAQREKPTKRRRTKKRTKPR